MESVKKLSVLFVAFLFMTAVKTLADDSEDAQNDDEVTQDTTEEEGVLVLTNDNFDEVTNNHNIMLVEFYTPWCGNCKALAPEYAKAAELLQEAEEPVSLAKVDAIVHTDLAQRFHVKRYPTLKFKKGGSWSDYNGERSADGIVSWVNERTHPNN